MFFPTSGRGFPGGGAFSSFSFLPWSSLWSCATAARTPTVSTRWPCGTPFARASPQGSKRALMPYFARSWGSRAPPFGRSRAWGSFSASSSPFSFREAIPWRGGSFSSSYVPAFFFPYGMNALRVGLALALLLLAWQEMRRRRSVPALGLAALAPLFHTSALVAVGLLAVGEFWRWRRKGLLALGLLALLGLSLLALEGDRLVEKVQPYLGPGGEEGGPSVLRGCRKRVVSEALRPGPPGAEARRPARQGPSWCPQGLPWRAIPMGGQLLPWSAGTPRYSWTALKTGRGPRGGSPGRGPEHDWGEDLSLWPRVLVSGGFFPGLHGGWVRGGGGSAGVQAPSGTGVAGL
jgi:hypothetical protein